MHASILTCELEKTSAPKKTCSSKKKTSSAKDTSIENIFKSNSSSSGEESKSFARSITLRLEILKSSSSCAGSSRFLL